MPSCWPDVHSAENAPMATAAVAFVEMVSTLDPFVIVMDPPVAGSFVTVPVAEAVAVRWRSGSDCHLHCLPGTDVVAGDCSQSTGCDCRSAVELVEGHDAGLRAAAGLSMAKTAKSFVQFGEPSKFSVNVAGTEPYSLPRRWCYRGSSSNRLPAYVSVVAQFHW